MERYSGTKAMEGVTMDPVEEWVAPGVKQGLKTMWQLGLGDYPQAYPERPDEPDCIYYLKTGFCGYGNRCRFNHPSDRSMVMGDSRSGGEYPERADQPVCQYYMKTGTCKFGATCKYHHPKHSATPVTLNICGYPLRPGEKECSYYVKTGLCKFGVTCRFHHPQPSGMMHLPTPEQSPRPLAAPTALSAPTIFPAIQAPSLQTSQQYGVIQGNWPITRPTMLQGSYVPGSYGPLLFPPGVVPVPWTPYPASLSPGTSGSTQPTIGAGPVYGIAHLSPSATAYSGSYISLATGGSSSSQKEATFPERPGQPDCQYYLKNGDCKFGASCKYHHPPEWNSSKSNFMLNSMGLPLRPGAKICSHYSQNGLCKFGSSCKFDHPMTTLRYSPSASSLTDMPVAPYPIGSTNATLAPSSSSSDVRPDLRTDPFQPQMSSMSSSTSASVGSIFSRNVPGIQQSGEANIASDSGITSSQGDEVQTSN